MGDKEALIREKVDRLNEAAKAYYQESREVMTNLEYDKLYDELLVLEKETGMVLPDSPTKNVGYEILSDLPKEAHASPMLSLDKTKNIDELTVWLGAQDGILSWKIDGITVVLTYREGRLFKAVTRGNGEIGEVITSNARVFANLPKEIAYKGEIVLRGEAFIKYSDFERINDEIENIDAKYKNPRNLCSGSVRQLNNRITAKRNVYFYAFALVSGIEKERRRDEFRWLTDQGFTVVEHRMVTAETLGEAVKWFGSAVRDNDVPSDGLVLILDDIQYGKSLGTTSKFPRDAIAFKWKDEVKETTLREIEWSASRTGLINPVAIFEPVQLEGTTVSRASVHNISIVKELELGIGDQLNVYKANMIIPQVADNLTRSGNLEIPASCPVCGEDTIIKKDKDVEVLYCSNNNCLAKQIKAFTHFASRNAMNIDGLSEATLEKFIARGYVTKLAELFQLSRHKDEIIAMEGFGQKSFDNLIKAIDDARSAKPSRFLYGLGIEGIGVANAKLISKACRNKWSKLKSLTEDELMAIDGIGDIMARHYTDFFHNMEKQSMVDELLKEICLDESIEEIGSQTFDGVTFVITGNLEHFENRDELKAVIEKNGGKTVGSVSKKTNYLINNDNLSGSTKNKKAKELNIPIITEDEFMKLLERSDGKEA